jgi:uncharacterized protein (TIGR03437 family)
MPRREADHLLWWSAFAAQLYNWNVRWLIYLLFAIPVLCAPDFTSFTFEARDGRYISQGPDYSLSITPHDAILILRGHRIQLQLLDASPDVSLEPLDRAPGQATYLRGRDLRASYQLYRQVRSRAVYPAIDMLFRGNRRYLEYDFEIAAGGNPGRVKLAFDGVDDLRIDSNGDLRLRSGTLEIRQPKPEAYQLIGAVKQPVSVEYQLVAGRHIKFRTGHYDHKRPLVIDPELVFDQAFGGSGNTGASAIALDSQGNIYVTGQTTSADFPTRNAFQAHQGGQPLIASSDLGQTWTDSPLGAAVAVYSITFAPSAPAVMYAATNLGVWKSSDGGATWTLPANKGFPSHPGVIAVDAGSPSLIYAASTQGLFVSIDGGVDWAASAPGVAIGNILTSPTKPGTLFALGTPLNRSTDFGRTWTPLAVSAGAIVFDPTKPGTLIAGNEGVPNLSTSTDNGDTWTPLGGLIFSGSLAIDPVNPANLYATGIVNANTAVLKSTDGGRTFSQVLSGVYGARLAIDPRNPATIYAVLPSSLSRSLDAGKTWSNLPIPGTASTFFVSPLNSRIFAGGSGSTNIFVTKWSPDGTQLLYATYLGGSAQDAATGIAVDTNGSSYVIGSTDSSDFPVTPNSVQSTPAGIFVAKLSPDGSHLIYSALLGRGGNQQSGGIAVDASGSAIITGSGNPPLTPNAVQTTPASVCDSSGYPFFLSGTAFLTKLAPDGGSLIFSTLLGGDCASWGTGVTLAANGDIWVAGTTASIGNPPTANFQVTTDALQPTAGGNYDGFLARFDSSGNLLYGTYLGGSGYDSVGGIALDPAGNIYLTGSSYGFQQVATSGAFRTQPAINCFYDPLMNQGSYSNDEGDAFVMKLDSHASKMMALTYLNVNACTGIGTSIAVDATGSPWILGRIAADQGSTLPTVSPFRIAGDAFLSKLSPDLAQLQFSTYYNGVALALDASGAPYVAGPSYAPSLTTQSAYLAKIDPAPSPVSLDTVAPAGTPGGYYPLPAIAAGEVLRLTGRNLGPSASTPGTLAFNNVLETTVAGVQVTFDGIAAPLLSVSATEIDCISPFELKRPTTTVQVRYNNVASNPVQVPVAHIALNLLAVLNDDFTPNSPANPARPGSTITLYLSGVGDTNPPGQDGTLNPPPPYSAAVPITVNNGDYLVTFSGAAPGLAAGIIQVNFIAPQQSDPNAYAQAGQPQLNYANVVYFSLAIQ